MTGSGYTALLVAQEHGRDFLAPLDAQDQEALATLLSRLAEGYG
ncbi:MAG: hypothetical protein QOF39_2490 [Frankiales bacterium]|jgi:hypothetical protein|nr:hypothetical protein [Frankiales bacterium]